MRNTKLIIGTMAASLAGLGIVVVATTRPASEPTPVTQPEHTSVRDQATPQPSVAPVDPTPPNPPPPQPITPKPQPLPAPVR